MDEMIIKLIEKNTFPFEEEKLDLLERLKKGEEGDNFPPPFCYKSLNEVADFYRRQYALEMAAIKSSKVNIAAQKSNKTFLAASKAAWEDWGEEYETWKKNEAEEK